MLEALGDVQKSLRRVASSGKVGPVINLLARLEGFTDRGVADQREPFTRVRQYTRQVRQVMKLLTSEDGLPLAKRKSPFAAKLDEFQRREDAGVYLHFAKVMASFRPGLFVRAKAAYPRDNLDLERWFRCPKSMSVVFTVIAMQGFVLCGMVRPKYRPLMPTRAIPEFSAVKTSFRSGSLPLHQVKSLRNTATSSCGKVARKKRRLLLRTLEHQILKTQ
jgi:hypothetical protein